jgi:hypothetical protein
MLFDLLIQEFSAGSGTSPLFQVADFRSQFDKEIVMVSI